MNSYLLLGGSGFIGANLARKLAQQGATVLIGTRRPDTVDASLGADPRIAIAKTDLNHLDKIDQLIVERGIDTVIHLASGIGPSSTDNELARERSEVTEPTKKLASLIAQREKKLVYFSSGGTIYGPSADERRSENDPLKPISHYGRTKLEIEQHIRLIHREAGLRYLILRPSNPYGPGQALYGRQGLISVILGKIASGEPLEVWGLGTAVRDYIHIDDLVDAVTGLLALGIENRTLNIGSGVGHSLLEVASTIEGLSGQKVDMIMRPARSADVDKIVLDVAALEGFGISRARGLEEGIRAYMRALDMIGD